MSTYPAPSSSTKSTYAAPSGRASSSVTYDYTGSDLIAKLLEEEGGLESARQGALYDGDIKTSLQAGDRIRRLRGLRSGIAPVRVRSAESSFSRDGEARMLEEGAPASVAISPSDDKEPKKKEKP
jgi:hypothetical protein